MILAAGGSLVYALVATWDDIRSHGLPQPGIVVAAFLLLAGAIGTASWSWSRLFRDPRARHQALVGYIVSQTSKYLPAGGAIQLGTQVSMSTSSTMRRGEVAGLTLVHLWLTVLMGGAVGALLLVPASGFEPLTVAFGLGVVLVAGFGSRNATVSAAVSLLQMLSNRVPSPSSLPGDAMIRTSAIWIGANFLLQGSALAILVREFDPSGSPAQTIGAFAWAWVAGFLVLPIPSGLGVREAVLVALAPSVTSGALIAASLVQRGLTIVAELCLALALAWWRRQNRSETEENV
ncbi:MAG: hypothetical protein GY745_10005 [Actinomycetia bacterium]|nr:hypothetical protein [Actinomycetes bacterium]